MKPTQLRSGLWSLGIFSFVLLAALIIGGAAEAQDKSLFDMPLQDVLDLNVTSVSKRSEKLSHAAAAAYVLTQEDIRRYGARSIPEALRLVPGVQVAQIANSRWAVSTRGFNGQFTNKLLVLIDGRSAYTPVDSGVFWESQLVDISDVDRIEVIRGPGATLWGSNAVNGVINIITDSAKDTKGSRLEGGIGTDLREFGSARTGFDLSPTTAMRVYANGANSNAGKKIEGDGGYNGWQSGQAGFRTDTSYDRETFMMAGDFYDGTRQLESRQPTFSPPYSGLSRGTANYYGGNLQGRWEHTFDDKSTASVQAFYSGRYGEDYGIAVRTDTYDLESQYTFAPFEGHTVVAGAGYRMTADGIHRSDTIAFSPDQDQYGISNLFIQDSIELIPNSVTGTFGTKLEYNDLSGLEVQPSVRLSWSITKNQTIWGSASRAVRTPARLDKDSIVDLAVFPNEQGGLTSIQYQGSDKFDSERLYAYELGYRIAPVQDLSIDIAAFYNQYPNQVSLPVSPAYVDPAENPPRTIVPLIVQNGSSGHSYGGELDIRWQALQQWRVEAWYALLLVDVDEPSNELFQLSSVDDIAPQNQALLRSLWDIDDRTQLDLTLRFVDSIIGEDSAHTRIRAYTELDARIGYKITNSIELSVAGYNLFDETHPEFFSGYAGTLNSVVRRSVYGMVTVGF